MYKNIKVIDSHCHVYPEKIAVKAVKGTDDFYRTTAKCLGTSDDLLMQNEKAGIDFSLIESVATTPKQVNSINTFIASLVESHKDRYKGLGTVHHESECMEDDINRIVELGLIGVKIHPDIQKVKIDDYRLLKVYEICEKLHLPVLFHTGDDRYDYSNPNRLIPILDTYDKLTVIGAHFGGYSVWEDAVPKLADRDNFYVDLSSSLMYIDKEKAIRYINMYGVDKVLFGTDYPMWNPKEELDRFLTLELSEEERNKILYYNAKKLYDLEV